MSDWGTLEDKLIALANGAVAGLDSERGLRMASALKPAEFPHLFVYDPDETATILDHQQEAIEIQFQLLVLTRDDTQEEIQLKVDAIRDAIRADKTLTGSVDLVHVSARGIRENPQVGEKAGDLTVITRQEV